MDLLLEFLRNPMIVGAVTASSPSLAREIVDHIDLHDAKVVVEFGSGTGPFTRAILANLPPQAHFMAVEKSERLAGLLREQFPQLDLAHDCVENLPRLLAERNLPGIDCIISGLPWAAFPAELQRRLLNAAINSMVVGGRFATFTYVPAVITPSGRRFRRLIEETFSSVTVSRCVWRNLPPAIVYRCIK